MIILDTNVVSGLMRRHVEKVVVDWFDRQPVDSLCLTAITVFEVEFGLNLMAPGKKRRQLADAFVQIHQGDLCGRVLLFDEAAASHAARLGALRRSVGRPIGIIDLEIAGIVAARSAVLATRDTRDFDGLGFDIINPWDA